MPEWRKCTAEDLPPHTIHAEEYGEGLEIYGADLSFQNGQHLLVFTDASGTTQTLERDDRRSILEKMVAAGIIPPRVHPTKTRIQ